MMCNSTDFAGWVEDLRLAGFNPSDIGDHDDAVAELDALVSSLYGFTAEQAVKIFQTFHRGWEAQSRVDRVISFLEGLK
jgi:hypothetical protein